ncbi:NitT/TauT family transport system substrate-binding protein [Actinacidiphila yanglinensis]|uniref:NitT/TauT family transport system substrate-binding protein n=1 Tax=Actinacidiphila yanglinensis TaxID=310779 RepID=A0A1H6DQX0_9ACTN|nr:NitT/TauT family transport system substrate-binding protein [Actinacidiphila yanglinensis]
MHTNINSTTVQTVAQKALPGIPTSVIKASLPQVGWPTSDTMTAADWAKTVAFVNSLGALTQEAKVTSSNYTDKYLP